MPSGRFSGFTAALPVGSTETGAWAFYAPPGFQVASAPISFNIPLAAPLDSAHVHYSTEATFGTFCEGTVEEPTAKTGELCVYQREIREAESPAIEVLGSTAHGASPGGAFVGFLNNSETEAAGRANGSWAVTG